MLDIITSDHVTGQPVHVDVTVTTACPENRADLRGRARNDGRGAANAAADKRRRYNLAGASFVPMAFEDGGRACGETISFVRRCGAAAESRGLYEATGGQSATATPVAGVQYAAAGRQCRAGPERQRQVGALWGGGGLGCWAGPLCLPGAPPLGSGGVPP